MNAYFVNGKPFFNIYLAYLEADKLNTKVEFRYFDEEFDRANWSKEPEQSFEQLMDIRASQLQLKYDKRIFLYSGGYDSQTIYNVLNRNKVRIDEFITLVSDVIAYCPHEAVTYAQQNWWDPTTTFTAWNRDSEQLANEMFDKEDWLYEDLGYLTRYSPTVPGRGQMRYVQEKYGNFKYCTILGYEKPTIVYKNGSWYARKLDKYFYIAMGYSNIEPFFCSPDLPELDIKQNYMLANAIEKDLGNVPDGYLSNDWQNTRGNIEYDFHRYEKHALACGRHREIMLGTSITQKTASQSTKLILDDNYLLRSMESGDGSERIVTERIYAQSKSVINYLKGWYALKTDAAVQRALRNALHDPNDIRSTIGIWSKEYKLG